MMYLKCGRRREHNCRIFHHDHELVAGMEMSQRDRPLSRFAHVHAAQLDEAEGCKRFQICFPIKAKFQSSSLGMSRPPSSFGQVISFQDTFAPPYFCNAPTILGPPARHRPAHSTECEWIQFDSCSGKWDPTFCIEPYLQSKSWYCSLPNLCLKQRPKGDQIYWQDI